MLHLQPFRQRRNCAVLRCETDEERPHAARGASALFRGSGHHLRCWTPRGLAWKRLHEGRQLLPGLSKGAPRQDPRPLRHLPASGCQGELVSDMARDGPSETGIGQATARSPECLGCALVGCLTAERTVVQRRAWASAVALPRIQAPRTIGTAVTGAFGRAGLPLNERRAPEGRLLTKTPANQKEDPSPSSTPGRRRQT